MKRRWNRLTGEERTLLIAVIFIVWVSVWTALAVSNHNHGDEGSHDALIAIAPIVGFIAILITYAVVEIAWHIALIIWKLIRP